MSECDALIGRTIGDRFSITALLAEGEMGAVFRGKDLDGTLEVAVKVLRPRFAADRQMRARFEREAEIAALLDHPSAVEVYAYGAEGDVLYMVMELVPGRDLFEGLVESGRLAPARAASIVLQICDALSMAHELGIVHRDIKPENVMLTGDPRVPEGERVKLLDFGVAKHLGSIPEGDDENVTVVGTILGTPAYMAPEQCLGNVVDARSDVYSCGALLYHLVTGRPLFEEPNPFNTLRRQINEAPRPPSELAPGLDPALEATILKALAKRPEDRHQSAVELWEELLPVLSRPSPTLKPPAEKAARVVPRLPSHAPRGALGAALLTALLALPACGRGPGDVRPEATGAADDLARGVGARDHHALVRRRLARDRPDHLRRAARALHGAGQRRLLRARHPRVRRPPHGGSGHGALGCEGARVRGDLRAGARPGSVAGIPRWPTASAGRRSSRPSTRPGPGSSRSGGSPRSAPRRWPGSASSGAT